MVKITKTNSNVPKLIILIGVCVCVRERERERERKICIIFGIQF
jgi:hypothetical protein